MATPDPTATAAAAVDAPEGGEESPLAGGPKKQADEQTHGLEKVTDYVEEQEITAELGQVRSSLGIQSGRESGRRVWSSLRYQTQVELGNRPGRQCTIWDVVHYNYLPVNAGLVDVSGPHSGCTLHQGRG